MPSSLGPAEILVILLVALIVLGPQKLPGAARQVGKTLAEVRRWSQGFQDEIRTVINPENAPAYPTEYVPDTTPVPMVPAETPPPATPPVPAPPPPASRPPASGAHFPMLPSPTPTPAATPIRRTAGLGHLPVFPAPTGPPGPAAANGHGAPAPPGPPAGDRPAPPAAGPPRT